MYNNVIFNQPVAIDKGYLLSLIPSIIASKAPFMSAKDIEQKMQTELEAQAAYAEQQGADKYPLVINIIGPILKYSSWWYIGTQSIIRIIQKAEQNEKISGILFNIDSGGGMVSGTFELCSVIRECSLPTIAYTNGYMCSAAYAIASACDARIAHPNADLIGSIGTMMSYQDYSAMFEKWGATIYELYASDSSEKNKEFRDLMKGDEKAYTERLNSINNYFVAAVKESVSGLKDDKKVFKGKTYTPQEALKIGLVNELGDIKSALSKF